MFETFYIIEHLKQTRQHEQMLLSTAQRIAIQHLQIHTNPAFHVMLRKKYKILSR